MEECGDRNILFPGEINLESWVQSVIPRNPSVLNRPDVSKLQALYFRGILASNNVKGAYFACKGSHNPGLTPVISLYVVLITQTRATLSHAV